MDHKSTSSIPLIVLFGVILAFLMAFIFITLYTRQLEIRVDEQAEALANDLAQTAFTSLSGGQPMVELPPDVGGSPYEIEVQTGDGSSVFVVKITGGKMSGNSYNAIVNAVVVIDNGDFQPGGTVYFRENHGRIIMSAAPIENLLQPEKNIYPTGEPPGFYYFAKENPKIATAIIAGYFFALENHPGCYVSAYKCEDDGILVQISSSDEEKLFGVSVTGYEDDEDVGLVDNAWIVSEVSETENLTSSSTFTENVENAYITGWIYSPSQALEDLRSRTWKRQSDNVAIVIPSEAVISASAATTNVSTYMTWRVEWEKDIHYVIYYRAMPWWENDDTPGFVFQSEPMLRPAV